MLDDADAEEQGDSGGNESNSGKPNGDGDSSEMEGAEASFDAKYEAVLQLIFGSFNPIARSKCGVPQFQLLQGHPAEPGKRVAGGVGPPRGEWAGPGAHCGVGPAWVPWVFPSPVATCPG